MRRLSLCLIVLLCMSFCGCSSNNPEPLIAGKYELEKATGATAPYLLLRGNNGFIFNYSNFSSYFNQGTYKIEDNTLILTTADEAFTYTFQIIDGNLYFNLKQSSKIIECKGEPAIEDGAKFVLLKDE